MPPPTPPGVPENVDPETLEPLPVERLLHGLSAQLIGDLTSAAEQDQSLKQPFLEQLVPALSVGDFPEKELLTSSSWRMSDLVFVSSHSETAMELSSRKGGSSLPPGAEEGGQLGTGGRADRSLAFRDFYSYWDSGS